MATGVFSTCYFLTVLLLLFYIHNSGSIELTLGFTDLSPEEVLAQRNAPLLLNCSGYSTPGHGILKTNWLYQGGEINDDNYKVLANGSLFVAKLQYQKRHKKDDGSYSCLLQNNVGSIISRPINVIIPRIAKNFSTQPESVKATKGGVTQFWCQIHSVPPAIITWSFNGRELPQNTSRHFFPKSGTLQIIGLTENDSGDYHCIATNGVRQRHSNKAFLTVSDAPKKFYPPQFLNSPSQHVVIENSSVILECLASGHPTPNISWEKKGENLPYGSRVFIQGQGNLVIRTVSKEDGGLYECTATVYDSQNGSVHNATQQSTLIVQVPPKFTKKPQSVLKPTAQTARLNCSVDGRPPPHIHWLKNAKPLYINGRIKQKAGNILVISQTVVSDSGIYQCIATNDAGTIMSTARIQVSSSGNQPSPPDNLKAQTVSSTSILLTWNPAISPNGLSIQAYTVHYVPTSGGIELQSVAVNTSQLISKLKPYTNYTFYVRAYNGKSASEQSNSIVQMTGEDLPIGVPVVTLSSLSTTTLRVLWTKMPSDRARGIIIGYRIHYRKHNQASYNVIEVAGTIQEYTITGLQPKRKYDVRVMGGTKAGFPSFSESVWLWETYEMPNIVIAKVPMAPVLHLTVVNITTIKVSWVVPEENQHKVEGFRLFYREQGRPLQGPISLPSSATNFILSDLSPQTWYEVHLLGFSRLEESEEAVRNILTLSQDNADDESFEVVEPPQNLEANPKSSMCVHLQWKEPTSSKNISYYTVRYGLVFQKGSEVNSSTNYIRSTDREVDVHDLIPFTLYEFSVRSHINDVQGPFSQTIECKTKEDVPSAPQELLWSPIDASSVRISWRPPASPNGMITAYYVLYNTRAEDMCEIKNWLKKEEEGSHHMTIVTGLLSNTLYYFCLRAATAAGIGPPSSLVALTIPVRNISPPSQPRMEEKFQDPFLGVVVGISIGVTCMVICAIIVVARSRLCQSCGRKYAACCSKRHISQANGSVFRDLSKTCSLDGENANEMECYTPMLTHVGNPEESGCNHLDTKGGYPLSNGNVNDCVHLLDRNASLTNGITCIRKADDGKACSGHPSPPYQKCGNGSAHLVPRDNSVSSSRLECRNRLHGQKNDADKLAPELLATAACPHNHYQIVPDLVVNSSCVSTESVAAECNGGVMDASQLTT